MTSPSWVVYFHDYFVHSGFRDPPPVPRRDSQTLRGPDPAPTLDGWRREGRRVVPLRDSFDFRDLLKQFDSRVFWGFGVWFLDYVNTYAVLRMDLRERVDVRGELGSWDDRLQTTRVRGGVPKEGGDPPAISSGTTDGRETGPSHLVTWKYLRFYFGDT